MTTVADLAAWMEGFAPARLAESWDNVGLLWGDPCAPVERVMTCLTVTPASASEAIERRAGLIVSHHPILFKPIQRLRADEPGGFLWDLARAGVAIFSPHTAFDNTRGGINEWLAERLGIREIEPLCPAPRRSIAKVVVFLPESDRESVLGAAFAAGGGTIGDYTECSYTLGGFGTFRGGEGTNPTIGEAGRRETVEEQRIEFVCRPDRLSRVLEAVRAAHSYEEPAVDIYSIEASADDPGAGRVGMLGEAVLLGAFATRVAESLNAPGSRFAGPPDRIVQRVAIACGGADEFIGDAARAGADAFLTGEARFHRILEAEAMGMGLILAGHYATERPAVEHLAERLAAAFPNLDTWPSDRETDPLRLAGTTG